MEESTIPEQDLKTYDLTADKCLLIPVRYTLARTEDELA